MESFALNFIYDFYSRIKKILLFTNRALKTITELGFYFCFWGRISPVFFSIDLSLLEFHSANSFGFLVNLNNLFFICVATFAIKPKSPLDYLLLHIISIYMNFLLSTLILKQLYNKFPIAPKNKNHNSRITWIPTLDNSQSDK